MEDEKSQNLKTNILNKSPSNFKKDNEATSLDHLSINQEDKEEDDIIDILDQKADIQLAYKHGLANRIYQIDYQKIRETIEIEDTCRCCGRFLPDNKVVKEYPYFSWLGEIAMDIGPGIYLYTYYIKFSLFLTFTAFLMSGFFQLSCILDCNQEIGKYCELLNSTECKTFRFKNNVSLYYFSYENMLKYNDLIRNNTETYNSDFIPNFVFMNFFLLIVLYIAGYLIMILGKNKTNMMDIEKTSASDYTLMISNLQSNQDKDELIKQITFNNITPIYFNPTFKIGTYFRLKMQYNQLKKKIQYCQENKIESFKTCFKNITLEDYQQELQNIENIISDYTQLMKKKVFDKKVFANSAFLTFNSQKEASDYLDQFPKSFIEHTYAYVRYIIMKFVCKRFFSEESIELAHKKITLEVNRAPEPNDIIWQNLHYTYKERMYRYLIINLICSFIIICGFFIIYFLSMYQKNVQENTLILKYSISFAITFVISLTNYILDRVLFYLTEYEKNRTFTYFYLSQSLKLTFLTFVNTAITPLLVNFINGKLSTNKELLMQDLMVIFLSNSIVTPLTYFLPPYHYFLVIQRKFLLLKKESNIEMTQKQANDIFENLGIMIAYKFSYLTKTVLMTFFYLPFFPLGSAISSLGLLLAYIIERHNILRFYKIPETLNEDIGLIYMNLFKTSLFLLTVGDYFFLYDLFDNKHWFFINILLTLILLPIPFNLLLPDLLELKEEEINQKSYDEIYLNLHEDYERTNPITKKRGYQHFVETLRDLGLITSEIYLRLMDDIDNNHSNNIEDYFIKNNSIQKNILHQQKNKFLSIIHQNLSRDTNKLRQIFGKSKGNSNSQVQNVKEVKRGSTQNKINPDFNPFVASQIVRSISKENLMLKKNVNPLLNTLFKNFTKADNNPPVNESYDLRYVKY